MMPTSEVFQLRHSVTSNNSECRKLENVESSRPRNFVDKSHTVGKKRGTYTPTFQANVDDNAGKSRVSEAGYRRLLH